MFKTVLENHLKAKAPFLEQDLMNQCAMILGEVAQEQNVSSYKLSMLFKVNAGQLIGQVIDHEAKDLAAFDAGGLFTEMFELQMKAVPPAIKGPIMKQLGGENLEQLLTSMLKDNYLLIRYNEQERLELYQVTADKSEKISIQVFVEGLKL